MQPENAPQCTFKHRTDLLAVQLGVNINDLPSHLGISRRTLYAGRSSDAAVSRKTWLKLEEIDFARTRITGRDLASLRKASEISKEDAAESLGISLKEYEILEEPTSQLTLGPLKNLQFIAPKLGGGPRGLQIADSIRTEAIRFATEKIQSGAGSAVLIRDAIDLLEGYIEEPDKISYLAEAVGIIHEVMVQLLDIKPKKDS